MPVPVPVLPMRHIMNKPMINSRVPVRPKPMGMARPVFRARPWFGKHKASFDPQMGMGKQLVGFGPQPAIGRQKVDLVSHQLDLGHNQWASENNKLDSVNNKLDLDLNLESSNWFWTTTKKTTNRFWTAEKWIWTTTRKATNRIWPPIW